MHQACNQLLDYIATHPHGSLKFIVSNMILAVHTDASYFSEPNSKSHATGHFFFTHHKNPNTTNAPIITLSTIIWHTIASASDAKLIALFYSCKQAIPLQITSEEMGCQQLHTILTTDNITAKGLTLTTMQPKALWQVQPPFVIELGTSWGGSAFYYGHIVNEYNTKAKIMTMDPALGEGLVGTPLKQ